MAPEQDILNPPAPSVGVEQAEAALVEHYPRLVRLAYLVLPPSLGRNRRVVTAHAIVQRSLPRGRGGPGDGDEALIPAARRSEAGAGPGYVYVRRRVVRQALEAGLPLRRRAWPKRAQFPPLLPQVWGLRLFPRSGGADELALDQRLSALSGPARAACVLRALERLSDDEVVAELNAAGATGARQALVDADAVEPQPGLLESAEFDPCSLQARPTDLMRRRQHGRAALAAVAALVVCGALIGLPGDGWGPDGAAAPSYAQNPAAQAALDPGHLLRVEPTAWTTATRTDFSVWPARGGLTGDAGLLRRALAVWARPGEKVQVSATPGTPSGPPMGAPQLLFAGDVDRARVVLLYDGLRVARYAEPRDGTAGAALDFARVDAADTASAGALVVGRTDGNVRYLTAPWVREASVRDLLTPDAAPRPLHRDKDGVTDPVISPAQAGQCTSWDALEFRDDSGVRLMTDLGELAPARLTWGPPSAPRDVGDRAAREGWARTACLLPTVRSHGVRSVNDWQFAQQAMPENNGTAAWICTRAETWRGAGSRAFAQFQAPSTRHAPGAIAARAENSASCGPREARVLAGVLWKSRGGTWFVLAAGSEQVASVTLSGGMSATERGNLLAVPAKEGARAELNGRLTDGSPIATLR
ncbi:hypothetical protein [Streptomyces sp. NBC_00083]|uniref:hypothetical protein n=1 Tax=Streptomyces sp. NBC_00083 TaxID=2975647 RepID=UPI00225069BF|nr:hypothetical protein [Streptomyces sp. NBC_00083]MCX5382832.1 hypothetical protein [Streptomyces sp. NBC_00083]